ncbi:MAG: glycosyltransferase family 4 protein [Leptospiraceae bacterium]|nr:glycosyltransferase family 4 protein [Leptospiraceae bacterium]
MIGWEYPPEITGGLAIACRGLARALAARGHNVHFLIPRLSGGAFEDQGVRVFSPANFTYTDVEKEEIGEWWEAAPMTEQASAYASIPEDQRSAASLREEAREIHGMIAAQLRGGYGDHIYQEVEHFASYARVIARRGNYDMIHAHDWMAYPAGIRARLEINRPLVCHVHATEFDRSGDHVNQFIYDMERYAFHFCDRIVTVSNYTKNTLVHRYAVDSAKVDPVHNAVEFELPDDLRHRRKIVQERPIKDKIVLFLGRITFQKGPDYFVRAARKVIDQVKNVRFVMVGTGDMYPRMIEMAADLGVGKYFHYTGFLNREEVRRIYAMSDLYVMPSVSEPFGISPLEAMLHGVPVIVSRQSGVSEVISNCIKVDFWDVDEITRSIVEVLTRDELSSDLTNGAESEVRQITWSQSAARMETVYDTIGG